MVRNVVRKLALALACLVVVAGSAEACARRTPAEARGRALQAGNINQSLLDAAVRAEVNFVRCQNGRDALEAGGGSLRDAAEAHSRWMARTGELSHRSTVPGRQSASDRIKAAGFRLRNAAENIGVVALYQIDGRRFRILDASACQFATYEGQALGIHSYETLARHIVATLMGSPAHRRNILDPRVNHVATGARFDASGPYCGRIWFTQDFVN